MKKALSDRLERLEAARRGDSATRLVLLAPHGRLTNEQQAAVDAARRDGRAPFIIAVMPRHEPLPVAARPSYKRRP